MGIRSRYLDYTLRVLAGRVGLGQLANLAHSRFSPRTELVSWMPTHISIFATDSCNLRCDMCPTHSGKIPENYLHRHRPSQDASVELLRFVLDRYPRTVRLSLIGTGEPLLNACLFDMISEATKRRMVVNTISNGLILDNFVKDIVGSGLDRISVSLNGHTSQEFHRMTGNAKESHSKIVSNIEALVHGKRRNKTAIRIEVSFIVDKCNFWYMADMIAFAEDLGVDEVVFLHIQPAPYPGFFPEERCVCLDDAGVLDTFKGLMSRKYRCDVTWPYLLKGADKERVVCRWPFSILQVDGDGNVGGCPMQVLNMHDNGKVYDDDPWNNEYYKDLRRRHLEGDLFLPCKSCVESMGINPLQVVR